MKPVPTQKEIAKLAGVSAGTVSNVISGSAKVSDRVRQKVLKAIKALNYHPNLVARSLKTNRTNTLGIVVPDITIPFFPKIVRGAESAARERGYFLIVLDSENSYERETEMLQLLRARRIDGILLATVGGHKELTDTLSHATPPVVCVDRLPDGMDIDSVSVDDRSAAELAVSHLLAVGHRDIAILTGPLQLKNEQERLRGYRHALQKAGCRVRESFIWAGSFDKDEINQVCQRGFLKSVGRPTALFTTNGVTGLHALRSMHAAGLNTPRDVAFVSFDELTTDDVFRPAITCVLQPAFEIGSRAVELLIDRVNSPRGNGAAQKIRIPATLVVRESSGTAKTTHA